MPERDDKLSDVGLPASEIRNALVAAPGPPLRSMRPSGGRRHRPESQGVSGQVLIRAMLHWWKVAFPVGLVLGLGAAAVVWWLFEPVYLAQSMIRIRETPPSLVFEVERESKGYVATQKEMIRSSLVLRSVVHLGGIKDLPELAGRRDRVDWLRRQLQLESVGTSEFLRIGFEGPDPQHAAKIVNAVVQEYFSLLADENKKQSNRVIALLEGEIAIRRTQVEQKQRQIQKKTLSEKGKDPFSGTLAGGATWPHPLAQLQNQLTVAEVEREVLEAEWKALQETPVESIEVRADELNDKLTKALRDSLEVQNLEYQIATAQTQLGQMETRAVHPSKATSYRQMKADLERNRKRLQEIKISMEQECRARLQKSALADREAELAGKKREIERGQHMEAALRQRYETEMNRVVPGTADVVSLEFEQAELARATDVLNRIEQRVVELRTEQQAPDRVRLFDAALPPEAPVEAVPYKQMALAILLGMCLPFGLAIGWEQVVRRIGDADQLAQETNLTVIGEIARLPERRMKARSSASKRMAQRLRLYEESIDSMRTFLVLAEGLQDVKVLAVTSATCDEGKTSVAAQLALSFARASGKPTLLIDGDLRAPDLHDVFEVDRTPGLAEVLRGECDLYAAIVPSWTPHVDLLPAGKLKASPHGLVGNGAMRSVLERVSSKYRYVILDTPPLLAAAEGLVLSKSADAALLCAMQDTSRSSQVRKACERLVAAGCRPVGAVLNGVSTRRYETHYGRYHYAISR